MLVSIMFLKSFKVFCGIKVWHASFKFHSYRAIASRRLNGLLLAFFLVGTVFIHFEYIFLMFTVLHFSLNVYKYATL